MPAIRRKSLKTWMLVYLGFVVALITASPASDSSSAAVSPGTYPTEMTADRHFFTPTIEHRRRNDI